jgi:hypothetical protein
MSAAPKPPPPELTPELTPEQLRLAYRQLQRPHWPTTLEEALAHPLHGNCIRGLARSLSRPAWHERHPPRPQAPPVPPTPTEPPARRALPRLTFDPRRAAANDRDDD